jgi:hypothetical protein
MQYITSTTNNSKDQHTFYSKTMMHEDDKSIVDGSYRKEKVD